MKKPNFEKLHDDIHKEVDKLTNSQTWLYCTANILHNKALAYINYLEEEIKKKNEIIKKLK